MNRIVAIGMIVSLAALAGGCAPSTPELIEQGVQHFRTNNLDKAKAVFNTVLERNPSEAAALFYKGRICQAEGFYLQAIYYYQCCFDADPSYPDLGKYLAQAQAAAGPIGREVRFIRVPAEE